MSAPTDEFTRIANDAREAFTTAVTAWSETAQRYAANFDAKNPAPSVADTQAAVDTAYELASTLLNKQHALATTAVEHIRALAVVPVPATA